MAATGQSIYRNQIAASEKKKHLSQGFLALIALYWNMRPLGQTPFQLSGVDPGEDDWVALIEHEMREQARLPVKRSA